MNKKTVIILVIIVIVIVFLLKSDKKMKYPVSGKITSKYGNRTHPVSGAKKFHNGIDIAVPIGTNVTSPLSGTVKSKYYNSAGGNQLIVEHVGFTTGYAHLDSSLVNIGDKVKEGQIIAKSGNTGGSTGPHLHLTLRKAGVLVDPENYFTI